MLSNVDLGSVRSKKIMTGKKDWFWGNKISPVLKLPTHVAQSVPDRRIFSMKMKRYVYQTPVNKIEWFENI